MHGGGVAAGAPGGQLAQGNQVTGERDSGHRENGVRSPGSPDKQLILWGRGMAQNVNLEPAAATGQTG